MRFFRSPRKISCSTLWEPKKKTNTTSFSNRDTFHHGIRQSRKCWTGSITFRGQQNKVDSWGKAGREPIVGFSATCAERGDCGLTLPVTGRADRTWATQTELSNFGSTT